MSILPARVDRLSFDAGGMRLLKEVSCRLDADKRTAIVGPNGAGKSLFLRLCHGLLEPSAGGVTWNQRTIKEARAAQAMVFQRPIMLRRSVAANLAYGLKLRKTPRNERRERVDEMLARTGLRRKQDLPARKLSGGEQQKLALARAWILTPEVLFLDEPTASLDPAATHAVEEIIQAICDSGTKIIMTSHDLTQLRRVADEVLFLHRGRLFEQAPVSQFLDAPKHELAKAFVAGELLWWRKGQRSTALPEDA